MAQYRFARPPGRAVTAGVVALFLGLPAFTHAQWQLETKDGQASIKFGFLAQGQGEWIEAPDSEGFSQNLFMRRFRILFGGKVGERWTFFFETDSPNVGKANVQGTKDQGDIFIQDILVTYDHSDAFKVDSGLLLFPISRNHGQGAPTLLPVDYGPYTFLESGPTGERVGRDYGVSLRGYPFGRKMEYRVALLQGVRGDDAENPFRFAARAAWHPFGSDTSFFYPGTTFATRLNVSIGGSIDRQKDYHVYSLDAWYEQPLAGGTQGVTLQGGWTHFDGARSLRILPEQDTFLLEAEWHFGKIRVSPFVQFAVRDFTAAGAANQTFLQGGFAYWLKGHQRNLKLGIGRFDGDDEPTRVQFVVQLQIFYF